MIDDYAGGADPEIEIRELGGTVGDTTLHVPGAAQFMVGDDILALVERTRGGWRPSAMSRSIYGVRDTVAGAELVRQEGGEPVGGAGPCADPWRASPRRFAPCEAAAPCGSRRRATSPTSANLESATPVVESYKLLGNMRWHEADSGATVPWYRNTLTPSPLDSGNSDAEIVKALSAWTNPAGASITLAYGGTRTVASSSLLGCGVPPVAGAGSSPTRIRKTTSPPAA